MGLLTLSQFKVEDIISQIRSASLGGYWSIEHLTKQESSCTHVHKKYTKETTKSQK